VARHETKFRHHCRRSRPTKRLRVTIRRRQQPQMPNE
jgi:hypothetical protein